MKKLVLLSLIFLVNNVYADLQAVRQAELNYQRQERAIAQKARAEAAARERAARKERERRQEIARIERERQRAKEEAKEAERRAKEERDYQEAMKDKRREQEYEDLNRQIEIKKREIELARLDYELNERKFAREEALRDKEREQKYDDLQREIAIAEERAMSEARKKQASSFVKAQHKADIKRHYTKTDSIQAENDATRYVAEGIKNNLSKEDKENKNVYFVPNSYKVVNEGKGTTNWILISLISILGGALLSGSIFWLLNKRKNNP